MDNQSKKPIFKRWWFWVIVVVLVFGIIGNTNSDQSATEVNKTVPPAASSEDSLNKDSDNTETKQNSVDVDPKSQENEKIDKDQAVKKEFPLATIGLTPEEFKSSFNSSSEEFDSDLRIKNISVQDGELQDTFQYMFTANLGIVGTVNKSGGKIRDVMLIGNGDGSAKSGADIVIAMGIIIAATNPELSTEDRGEVLKELGLFDENVDVYNLDKNTVRNGIKYRIQGSEVIGIMFSAGDVNDK
ncbi:hypothetical protein [Paenibacillus aquistagni]|uniref:hypothetical protein n=1 Tax=Paenibacillus aquistagni TaxID=1852522 RepID=UPI00145A7927|nr:hypothetical protein [Paenibacillus aquistagni]NMM52052.1 hypothetical protein [Paenibacillus aquistagni]